MRATAPEAKARQTAVQRLVYRLFGVDKERYSLLILQVAATVGVGRIDLDIP